MIHHRAYQSDADFWRVRDLLVEAFALTPPGYLWDVRRWDGWRFHNADPAWNPEWEQRVRLWETREGRLVGMAHPEGRGDAFLEIHPDYREIEEEMIAWAEEHLAAAPDEGRPRQLEFSVMEYDGPRRRLLEKRGYQKTPYGWVIRRMRFGSRGLPEPHFAEGYRLRTTRPGDQGDAQRVADILNAAFNRDFHSAADYGSFASHAPCFRQDLDLAAEAPDGTFAAYVGVIYEETNRHGIFEPVCTHPAHRRKGLAQSLMFEGLRRLKTLGACDVSVETGSAVPANALYDSIGFTEVYQGYVWRKVF